MKRTLIMLFSIISFLSYFGNIEVLASSKEHIKQDTILVSGLCDNCKERIENGALIKGVKKAQWNKYSKELVVIYNSEITDLVKIQKAINEEGYDTENFKATDKQYSKLPKCCAYREKGAKTH